MLGAISVKGFDNLFLIGRSDSEIPEMIGHARGHRTGTRGRRDQAHMALPLKYLYQGMLLCVCQAMDVLQDQHVRPMHHHMIVAHDVLYVADELLERDALHVEGKIPGVVLHEKLVRKDSFGGQVRAAFANHQLQKADECAVQHESAAGNEQHVEVVNSR